jgi:hypothetical protein
MAERVFYSDGGVIVTPARVTIRGDNYFVNQIATSKVRYTVETDKMKDFLRKAAIALSVIVGIVLMVQASIAAGALIAIVGIIAAFVFIKPQFKMYHVYLGMSSGEVDAYRTLDSNTANAVANAVNEALASRA